MNVSGLACARRLPPPEPVSLAPVLDEWFCHTHTHTPRALALYLSLVRSTPARIRRRVAA